MSALSLVRVARAALAHTCREDHLTALTQVVGIETVAPNVWVAKTKTYRHTMASTGWLVLHLPETLPETHPGGENVDGIFCIDYVTENAAFRAAKMLAGEVV